MSTSTIPAVLDALVDALKAVPGLSGVGVFSGPAGDSGVVECIEIGSEIQITESAAGMGGIRDERFDVEGSVFAIKPGASEAAIRAARDRAFDLFAEVETYLNDNHTVGGTCATTDISKGTVKQGYFQDGRICSIEFTVAVTSFVNP